METLDEIKAELERQTIELNGGNELQSFPPLTHNGLPVVFRKEDINGDCYLVTEMNGKTIKMVKCGILTYKK